ncbi:chromatin assembly factor 1 subunit A-domain-containing protein [Cunninghamella echinulata]|nr:chromatin assembly factor 1 subunit A-domain-containing protein [Cunninghamella echinulata]
MEMKYKYLQELNKNRPQLTKPRGIHRKVDLKNLLLPGVSGSNLDAIHRPEYKLLLKMKFLQFTEDVRPAYYGTWTKQSDKIKGNAPFTKDIDILDYEHESEAEWEPEGEGEDIQSGDDDDDDAPEMADSEDIGWLVPEGYLSEGEGVDSDDGMSKIVNRLSMRPNSRKKLTIRPVIIGPILENDDDMVENEALVSLGVKTLINIDENGYNPFAVIDNKPTDDTNKTITTSSTNNTNFTEEHTTELLNIFEGKADNLPKLLSEAKASPLLNSFPKTQLEAKIRDIAVKEKRGNDARPVWHVKPEKDSTIQ